MKALIIIVLIMFFVGLASASIVSQEISSAGIVVKFSDGKVFKKTTVQFQKEFTDYKNANPLATVKECQTFVTTSTKQGVTSMAPYYFGTDRIFITVDATGVPIDLTFEIVQEEVKQTSAELKSFKWFNFSRYWILRNEHA